MTENSRPSPFFSCGKMNLVILGISSIRTGLISKNWYINDDTAYFNDPFVLHFLFWNWWGIVGIWSIYDPFKRIPKQHMAGWYSLILLVQISGHQFKY